VKNQDLRDAGLKVTLPRIKILELLETSPHRHLSAEEIYQLLTQRGEDVGLATVYRVLAQFESASLVTRHHFEGGHCVYELNSGEHHDHLVCTDCGAVKEFIDDLIEERQKNIAKQEDFTMTGHSLIIYGLCGACSKKEG